MKRKYIIVIICTPLLVFIDQFTKWLVVTNMHLGRNIQVIDDFLSWHYLRNPGAAFGMFRGINESFRAPFFLLVSICAMAVVIYYLVKSDDEKLFFPACLAFVLSGAFGNLIDRLRLGYVVDFILVEATFLGKWVVDILDRGFGTHHWPSFNVADSLIVVGIIGMAVDLMFFTPIEEELQADEKSDSPGEDGLIGDDGYRESALDPPEESEENS